MGDVKAVNAIAVRVLCFAQLKDRFGESEFQMTLPEGARGRDLVERLGEHHPVLKPLLEVSRLAINCEYTSSDQLLKEGDEVAVIPPVSGG